MKLEHAIEALLFWRGEPVSLKELMKDLGAKEESVHEALVALSENLKDRGLVLLANEEHEYMLGTSTEASSLIEKLTKEELSKDLGKASLETLSLIIYKGPIKRSEIDYVRGVNSTFILRNLLIRGLIDKKPAPDDNRTSIYTPSFKLLSYLGVEKISDLPNFSAVQEEIEKFKNSKDAEDKENLPKEEPSDVLSDTEQERELKDEN
jgi:segregation and condensation protein B